MGQRTSTATGQYQGDRPARQPGNERSKPRGPGPRLTAKVVHAAAVTGVVPPHHLVLCRGRAEQYHVAGNHESRDRYRYRLGGDEDDTVGLAQAGCRPTRAGSADEEDPVSFGLGDLQGLRPRIVLQVDDGQLVLQRSQEKLCEALYRDRRTHWDEHDDLRGGRWGGSIGRLDWSWNATPFATAAITAG